MADNTSIPIIVQGNTFSLAIPLQIYQVEGGSMVLQDYTPDPTDVVTIQLKGDRRQYTYTPSITDNIAYIDLDGNELADNYGVVVTIVKQDSTRLRSFRTDQFFIVESSDDLTTDDIIEGLENNVIYLNSQCFVAGEAGVGIASIAKTGTQGLVDTYTITMTNGTTYTYQVTNGKDGQDGTDGVGIVSITKTSTSGLVDTYTILLTNGTTTTFTVTNGSDATQVQSDWSQSDSTAVDFIKNKPTNVSAFNNDAGYLNNNFCPIIEDTRSSNASNITGVAPFSTLVDKQKVIIHLAYATVNYTTLQLTLNDGVTTTNAIPIYARTEITWLGQIRDGHFRAGTYMELIYNSSENRWYCLNLDRDTTTWAMGQSDIDNASNTDPRAVPGAKLLCNNFSKHTKVVEVSGATVTQTLNPNTFYKFTGSVTSLTLTLGSEVSGITNIFAFSFTAGQDAPTITLPQSVTIADAPDIHSGDYVEFNILDGKAIAKVWAV